MRFSAILYLLAMLPPAPAIAQDSLPDSTGRAAARRLSGALLQRLPIDDPRHALPLVAGVVLRTSDIGIDTRPLLLIRGGRRGAMNVYVDGAPLKFQTLGSVGIVPAVGAVEELSVITGVAPPELGDVGGGALLYTTRAGSGARWGGDVRWDSDEPFGDAYTVGYNRIVAAGGGALGSTSLFASLSLQGQRSAYRGPGAAGVPTYMPAGIDTTVADAFGRATTLPLLAQWSGECDGNANAGFECQGLRRPLDWSSIRRLHAKIEHRYGTGRLSVTGLAGDFQQRFFPGESVLNPALYAGRRAWTAAAIVNWRPHLGTLRGSPVDIVVNASLVRHGERSGPLEPESELATREPYLGIAFRRLRFLGADTLGLPASDALIRDVRTNSGTRGVAFFGNLNEAGQAHRGNPYGLSTGWSTGGIGGTLADASERRFQGRWALLWQPAMHTVTVGLDAERSEVSGYASGLLRLIDSEMFTARPRRWGIFAGDRLVIGNQTIINLGLRYDRFNVGGEFPNTPLFISSSGPAFWNPLAATDDTAYENSVARTFHPARSQGVVSPRLRFSQVLSPTVDLHLGYSRTAEPPSWQTYFARTNADLSNTATNQFVGRDVAFAAGSLIEADIRAVLGTRATLEVGLYRKDLPDYVARISPFRDPRDTTRVVSLNVLTTFEDARAEGIDVHFAWRGGWLDGAAAYSLARTRTDMSGSVVPATDDVVAHAMTVAAALRGPEQGLAAGLEAVVLLRAQSGEPYTRFVNEGRGTVTPARAGVPAELFNASQTPWTTRLDLRVAKAVRAAGRDWSIYVDARNVLNARNLIALFAETGGTVNAIHRQNTIGDPTLPSGEYAALRNEAANAGALEPDGTTVNLTSCPSWGSPVNCVALTRVERRFGDGNGLYTLAEQERAFNAHYDDFFGAWRFYGSGRTLRVGVSLGL